VAIVVKKIIPLKLKSMKPKYYFILIIFTLFSIASLAQNNDKQNIPWFDTLNVQNLNEVVVSATRTKVPLKEQPAAISIVTAEQLNELSKTIAADEALRLVPGVRVDNGTGGSRVHLYIRGQGVLTEVGFRGVGVMIDGISINDPGGFAPDLYDVDWVTVKNVEVVKGLAASMYGAGSTGGVVSINTMDGGKKPVNGLFYASAGSDGFWKVLGQVDGTQGNVNYRVSYSHTQGNGYRIHQAFKGDIFNEKINWTPSNKIKITQILTYSDYFNQNSEGISYYRYLTNGPRAANTDAIPFNEFHKTQRLTGALIGKFDFCKNQDIQLKAYMRMNNNRETSNNGDDYKPFINPGFSAQYDWHAGKENLMNHFSIGGDYTGKTMTEHAFGPISDPNRVDTHFGESYIDDTTLKINQIIKQRGVGIFLIDKLDIAKKLFATVNLRYDNVYNELINNIPVPDSIKQSGSKTFDHTSFRVGLAYDAAKFLNIYANYGTGFLVPTEDELYNNPVRDGGFNETIKPSTMQGGEIGVRGEVGKFLYYNIDGFLINSKNEFYRLSLAPPRDQVAAFGNVGASKRWGIETFVSYSPVNFITLDAAYTYSHFQYTEPVSIKNHWIPQCPEHMLTAEVAFKFLKHFTLTLGTQYQSKWYIQVDSALYQHYTEIIRLPTDTITTTRNSWVNGFNTYSANLSYNFKLWDIAGELSIFGKNLFDEHYFGFTEPNSPDDFNSYQPAPGRELFVSLKLRF
jgi:iron complex outermembrane recepter protein